MALRAKLPAGFVPAPGARLRARIAHRLLRFAGWRIDFDGRLPGPKGVIIAYPHTSNWDFAVGLLAIWALDLPIRWIGKETLFSGWLGLVAGPVLRRWGGQPVYRHAPTGAVEQLAHAMEQAASFWLALSPEGTRRKLDHWRSGFYHLTCRMQVPLGLAYFDFPARTVGISGFIALSGNQADDMQRIAQAYAGRHGHHPALESTIALESAADAAASAPQRRF